MFNFKNVGREIKLISKILAWIIFVIGLILAFLGLIAGLLSGKPEIIVISVALALVIAGLSYVAARLNVILLYGFGELIDQVQKINYREDHLAQRRTDPPVGNAD